MLHSFPIGAGKQSAPAQGKIGSISTRASKGAIPPHGVPVPQGNGNVPQGLAPFPLQEGKGGLQLQLIVKRPSTPQPLLPPIMLLLTSHRPTPLCLSRRVRAAAAPRPRPVGREGQPVAEASPRVGGGAEEEGGNF